MVFAACGENLFEARCGAKDFFDSLSLPKVGRLFSWGSVRLARAGTLPKARTAGLRYGLCGLFLFCRSVRWGFRGRFRLHFGSKIAGHLQPCLFKQFVHGRDRAH